MTPAEEGEGNSSSLPPAPKRRGEGKGMVWVVVSPAYGIMCTECGVLHEDILTGKCVVPPLSK